jgi:hypothetical protein
LGRVLTNRCDEEDDDKCVKYRNDGRADGSDNVAQALQTSKEAEDAESPKHLQQNIGNFIYSEVLVSEKK